MSNPEILNSVPFRAGITDSHGTFLAVNRFLASCVRAELVGRNIIELVSPEDCPGLIHIITKRAGSVECTMPDISAGENFYPFDVVTYLDDELNELPKDAEIDSLRRVVLHATPAEWNGTQAVMMTFEDVTEFRRTHDQLRRLLTVDTHTGILNRSGIEHVIRRRLTETVNDGGHMSLIAIRVENFRYLNETRGYAPADRIMRSFVRAMKKYLEGRPGSVLGRWSEDEFVVVAQCSGAAAVVMANEIRANTRDVIFSAGVADLTDGGYMSASEFIGAAYDAMCGAVKSGGNATALARNS